MLHRACVREEAGARNLVFFCVKWLQPAMKGTSCVRRLRLRSFRTFLLCVLQRVVVPFCSCVRNSFRFLKLWLQIALEWLHDCCMGFVLGRKPEHGTLYFPTSLCGVLVFGAASRPPSPAPPPVASHTTYSHTTCTHLLRNILSNY